RVHPARRGRRVAREARARALRGRLAIRPAEGHQLSAACRAAAARAAVSTDWPTTEEALIAVQRQLAAVRPEPWRGRRGPRGGAGSERGRIGPGAAGDRGWAAATVLVDHKRAGVAVLAGRARAPYVPGMLAMRDGPLLEAAVRRLPVPAEVLLVNATGRDHPR